jgi:prepilin-type N-terminal cleavage/methylation domain-containing protein
MLYKKGVTLIELLIVVVILGALAFVAVPRLTQTSQNAKENACSTNLDVINSQIELYYLQSDAYPSDIAQITENLTYFPDGAPSCPLGGTYSLNSQNRAVCDHSSEDGGCGW